MISKAKRVAIQRHKGLTWKVKYIIRPASAGMKAEQACRGGLYSPRVAAASREGGTEKASFGSTVDLLTEGELRAR